MCRTCWMISISISLLLLDGCQNQQNQKPSTQEEQAVQVPQLDFTKIKVAMTYDEVEKMIGKPSMINRGANEFETQKLPETNDREELTGRLDLLTYALNYKRNEGYDDSTYLIQPQEISNVGSLIYVRWDYPGQIKQDTFWTFQVSYRESTSVRYTSQYFGLFEDIESVEPKYRTQDKLQFSDKEMYDKVKEGKYYSVITKDFEKSILIIEEPLAGSPYSRKLLKKSIVKNGTPLRTQIPVFSKEYYTVQSVQSVFFDASSGRVRNVGWNPINIARIFPL